MPLLFLVLGGLAVAAILVRNQVIGAVGRTRVSLGFVVGPRRRRATIETESP